MTLSTASVLTVVGCTAIAIWFAYRAATHIRGVPVLKHAAGESLAEVTGGVSHIRGLAERDTSLATAPTGTDCLAYRVEIYPDGNINDRPAKTRTGNVPFYVIDGSDALRVDPTEAELVKTTVNNPETSSIKTEIGNTAALEGAFAPGGKYVARYLLSGDEVSIIGEANERAALHESDTGSSTVDVGPSTHGMYTIADSETPLVSGAVHRSLLASTAAGSAALLAQTIGLMTIVSEVAPYIDGLTTSHLDGMAAVSVVLTAGVCTSSLWYWRAKHYHRDGVPLHASLLAFVPVVGLGALLFTTSQLFSQPLSGSIASLAVIASGGGALWYLLRRYANLLIGLDTESNRHS